MKQLSVILESKISTEIFEKVRCEILAATLDNPDEAKLEKLLEGLYKKTREEQIKFLQKEIVLNLDALKIILKIIFRDFFAAEKLKISDEVVKNIKAKKF